MIFENICLYHIVLDKLQIRCKLVRSTQKEGGCITELLNVNWQLPAEIRQASGKMIVRTATRALQHKYQVLLFVTSLKPGRETHTGGHQRTSLSFESKATGIFYPPAAAFTVLFSCSHHGFLSIKPNEKLKLASEFRVYSD